MENKEPITKKLRFDVFKRDGFKCQYCGKTPPEVKLEVDHIIPRSKNGLNDINNLITSCFDCNRGKSNTELQVIPKTLQENKELIEERELQYNEYLKLLKKVHKRESDEIKKVVNIYSYYFFGFVVSKKFEKSIRMFIDKLNLFEVCNAMEISCEKFNGERKINCSDHLMNDTLRYFCGICYNKIRGGENQ